MRRFAVIPLTLLLVSQLPACSSVKTQPDPVPAAAAAGAADALAQGDRQLRAGALDRALYFYLQALEQDDTQAQVWYKIGVVHDLRGNAALAGRAYGAALQRDASHPGALVRRGRLLLKAREYEAAKAHFERAATLPDAAIGAHNGLGIVADLQREHAQAAGHFEAALAIDPAHVKTLVNLGYSHYLAGNWAEAEQALEGALNVDAGHVEARQNLGLLRARQGRYAEAIEQFSHVMSMAAAYNDVGYAAMLDGKHAAAERFFRTAIRLSPTYHASANDNLAYNRKLSAQNQNQNQNQNQIQQQTRNENPIQSRHPPAPATPEAPAQIAPAPEPRTVLASEDVVTPSMPPATYDRRYVAAQSLRVRELASASAPILGRLSRGQVVRVLRRDADWAYVKYWRHDAEGTEERTGWVYSRYLTESRYARAG